MGGSPEDAIQPEKSAMYSDTQLCVLAAYADRFLSRPWFDGLFDAGAQLPMARLLIGIFLCYQDGSLATKGQASDFMQTVDARTSKRYIGLAEQHQLLTIAQSKLDQRVDLLCPTPKLLDLVRTELRKMAEEFEAAMDLFLIPVWMKSGTPIPRLRRHATFLVSPHSERFSDQRAFREPGSDPKFAEVIERESEIIDLAPENAAAYRKRADSYHGNGELEKAIADYTVAIRLDPEKADTFCYRGSAYADCQMFGRAVADMSEAIRLRPAMARYYRDRGEIYLENLLDYERAVSDFTAGIRCAIAAGYPPSPLADYYLDRAYAYQKQGNREQALSDLRTAASGNRSDLQGKIDGLRALLAPNDENSRG